MDNRRLCECCDLLVRLYVKLFLINVLIIIHEIADFVARKY